MAQIRTLYNTVYRINEKSQLPTYYPPRLYTDAAHLKYQRQKIQIKYQKDKPKKKLDLNCTKHTFIEQIQKRQKKLPSPDTYSPSQYEAKYKKKQILGHSDRITIFQQLDKYNKNNPSPSPLDYNPTKPKLKSNSVLSFTKAQNNNYADGVMYCSSQSPGVGQYNIKRSKSLNKFGKFDKGKKSQKEKENKLPNPFTYYPKLMDKKLFSEIKIQKNSRSNFSKQKRFDQKQNNENKKLFYTGISEWGMKTNYKKKDILDLLSKHNIYSKSVYYQ